MSIRYRISDNSLIRQLEIKFKGQNSINFYDLRGDTRLEQLTEGTYIDDNGVEHIINLWGMINNGLVELCIEEWQNCESINSTDPQTTLKDIWKLVSPGGTDNPDSLKLWGKKSWEAGSKKYKKKSKKKSKSKKPKKKRKTNSKKSKKKSKKSNKKSKSRRRYI